MIINIKANRIRNVNRMKIIEINEYIYIYIPYTSSIPVLQSKPVNPERHSHLYPRAASGRQFCVLLQGSSVQVTTGKCKQNPKKTV